MARSVLEYFGVNIFWILGEESNYGEKNVCIMNLKVWEYFLYVLKLNQPKFQGL
jgi:hypothetical protein